MGGGVAYFGGRCVQITTDKPAGKPQITASLNKQRGIIPAGTAAILQGSYRGLYARCLTCLITELCINRLIQGSEQLKRIALAIKQPKLHQPLMNLSFVL